MINGFFLFMARSISSEMHLTACIVCKKNVRIYEIEIKKTVFSSFQMQIQYMYFVTNISDSDVSVTTNIMK